MPPEAKAKRAPSAYNNFMSENLKIWKEKNPDKPTKEGMAAVSYALVFATHDSDSP